MDLVENLCDSINNNTDLPHSVIIGFMRPGECIALLPGPGSATIEEDWSGNETRRINYTIAMRTKDEELANRFLWQISNYLDVVNDIPSQDGSYQFEQIEQTGLPNASEQDVEGFSDYALDFFVQIITNTRN